jgi:hypothetical protein
MATIAGPSAYATSADPVRFRGDFVAFPAGQSSHDLDPGIEIRLRSGSFWARGANLGDRISLAVVSPEGAEVSRYCDRLPVPPFEALVELAAPTAGLVPAGFRLRITYENTGANPVAVGAIFSWFEVQP